MTDRNKTNHRIIYPLYCIPSSVQGYVDCLDISGSVKESGRIHITFIYTDDPTAQRLFFIPRTVTVNFREVAYATILT